MKFNFAVVLFSSNLFAQNIQPSFFETDVSKIKGNVKFLFQPAEGVYGQGSLIHEGIKTVTEDFSYFSKEVAGLFFDLGGLDPKKKANEVSAHHTPDFYIEESGFNTGVQAFCNLVMNYLNKN